MGGPGYAWQATGTGKEILVTVPMPKDITIKEMKVDIRTFSLLCKVGDKVVIDHKVSQDVDMDDSHWDIELKDDTPYLLIYLAKLKPEVRWESLLQGGDPKESSKPDMIEPDVVDVDAALLAVNSASRRGSIIDSS